MERRINTATYGIRHPLAQALLVALAYLAAGWIGMRVPVLAGHITLFWLPSGIALAGVLLWGYRVLPGVALGAAFVPLALGAPAGAIAGHTVGATTAAFFGGMALQGLNLRDGFRHGRDAFYFVIVALLSPLLSATLMVLGIAASGVAPWSAAFVLLRDAWIGHTMGIIVATPLLVAWAEAPGARAPAGSAREGAALFIGLIALTILTWSGQGPRTVTPLLLYALLPFFVWAALRFRFRVAATATAIGWIGAVTGSLLGYGPFSSGLQPLIYTYAYLGVAALTTYVIAGLVRERRDATASLSDSEQRFRDLISSAPDIILQVDRTGRIQYGNRDHFGDSRVVLKGRLQDLVAPAYAAPMQDKVELVFWNATASGIEVEVGKGRNTRHFSLQLGPLHKGERVVAVMVIGQDITERKRAENALRQSEARLRTYFEGSPLPIAILDLTGRFLETNPAITQMLDAGDTDLSDLDLVTIAHPRDKDDVLALLDRLSEGRSDRVVSDVRLLQREGQQVWVRLRTSLIRDAKGTPMFIVAMMEDVSASKRAIDAEHLAATRALKIGELEEMSEWKTQLLNIASHELKNPLTPMRLQLDLMRRGIYGPMNDRQEKAVGRLGRQSERLSMMVSGILDVARLQTGRLEIQKGYADMRAVVSAVCDEFEDAAREWGIILETQIDGRPDASADPERLKQVIFNLLSNALKFTPKGGRVTVRTAIEDDHLVVRVDDTGPGLAQDQIDRLFEAFTQVHDTVGGDKKDGMGLGLYITRGIVEAHGGKVWAESRGPGEGSTFAFRIPRGDVAAAKRDRERPATESLQDRVDRLTGPPAQDAGDIEDRIDRLIQGLEPGLP